MNKFYITLILLVLTSCTHELDSTSPNDDSVYKSQEAEKNLAKIKAYNVDYFNNSQDELISEFKSISDKSYTDCSEEFGIDNFRLRFKLIEKRAKLMKHLVDDFKAVSVDDCKTALLVLKKTEEIIDSFSDSNEPWEAIKKSQRVFKGIDSVSLSKYIETKSLNKESISGMDIAINNANNNTINKAGVVRYEVPGGFCTGSIISSNMILTSAHCIDHLDPDGDNVGLYTGLIEYFDPDYTTGRKRTLADGSNGQLSFAIWPGYAGTANVDNDLAVIGSWTPFDVNSSDIIPFAALSNHNFFHYRPYPRDNESVIVYGAGTVSMTSIFQPDIRYYTHKTEAWGSYSFWGKPETSKFNCKGDSGGPWVAKLGYSKEAIIGLTHSSQKHSGDKCTRYGGATLVMRLVSGKSLWISDMQPVLNPSSSCSAHMLNFNYTRVTCN